ncbi:MAG: tRNA (adenosine(37)-N6)-threonylcarbamoyltransferase complex ATPase subunit type 1 TsaE [Desulfopila sp.]
MGTYIFHWPDLAATERFGFALGKAARPDDIICLDGDLGAGKTALSQAIARGLDVPADCYVTSPSFAILHEYPGRMTMYHMDFYRLGDAAEIIDLGFTEYFYALGLAVIEWSKRAGQILPPERLELFIEIGPDDCRKVTMRCTAPALEARILDSLVESGIAVTTVND